MKGFDPRFKDFPDYILGITKEIWEERGIATTDAQARQSGTTDRSQPPPGREGERTLGGRLPEGQ